MYIEICATKSARHDRNNSPGEQDAATVAYAVTVMLNLDSLRGSDK